MPPLPIISGKEAVRVFAEFGFEFVRQKGSHMAMTKPGHILTLSVPDHDELDRGTLRSLIRKAGVSVDEFIDALDK